MARSLLTGESKGKYMKTSIAEFGYQVMVVDDDDLILDWFTEVLGQAGVSCVAVSNGVAALEMVRQEPRKFVAVFVDYHLKQADFTGAEIARSIKAINKDITVKIISGDNTEKAVNQYVEARVDGFSIKPLDADKFQSDLYAIFCKYREKLSIVGSDTLQLDNLTIKTGILGRSQSTVKLKEDTLKIAQADQTVLIHGENGTGKELIANAIHNNSARKNGPFNILNCGVLNQNLVASELFGHKRGAFTGADKDQLGIIRRSEGGTLFLDEIGDMPSDAQVALLRVLQEKEVRPVGSTSVFKVNVRILAATNIDLLKAVEEGRFRKDLYFRLNVLPICSPPLKERVNDLDVLVPHFIKKHCSDRVCSFRSSAIQRMKKYSWPGNVRELENDIIRHCSISDSEIIDEYNLDSKFFGDVDVEQEQTVEIENAIFSIEELSRKADAALADNIGKVLGSFNSERGYKTKASKRLGVTPNRLHMVVSRLQKEGHYVPHWSN